MVVPCNAGRGAVSIVDVMPCNAGTREVVCGVGASEEVLCGVVMYVAVWATEGFAEG